MEFQATWPQLNLPKQRFEPKAQQNKGPKIYPLGTTLPHQPKDLQWGQTLPALMVGRPIINMPILQAQGVTALEPKLEEMQVTVLILLVVVIECSVMDGDKEYFLCDHLPCLELDCYLYFVA